MPKRAKTGGRVARHLGPTWSYQLDAEIHAEIEQLAQDLSIPRAEALRGCLAYLWSLRDYNQLREILRADDSQKPPR